MNSYEITYIITNIFGTYVIYKMLRLFFDKPRTCKRTELLSYMIYYFVNLLMFFTIRKPIILLAANIALFFGLSFNYHAYLAKKVIFSCLSYIILMLVESLVVLVTGYFAVPVFGYSKYDIPVPNFYWFSTIFVSLASLYIFVNLFVYGSFNQPQMIIMTTCIIGTNFAILFLYDTLYSSFSAKTEKVLLEQQNKAYEKQLDLMRQSLDSVNIVRHDIKNHMIALKNLNADKENTKFDEYVDSIISSVNARTVYSNSENLIIDSILNYKLQTIASMEIELDVEVAIPKKLDISDYDMTIILGNLIDNAITALKKCSGKKFFSIKMNYSKGNVMITLNNTYNGEIKEKNGILLTLKNDEKNHGMGLKSIEEAVNRNNGYIKIHYDDESFKTTVILPG